MQHLLSSDGSCHGTRKVPQKQAPDDTGPPTLDFICTNDSAVTTVSLVIVAPGSCNWLLRKSPHLTEKLDRRCTRALLLTVGGLVTIESDEFTIQIRKETSRPIDLKLIASLQDDKCHGNDPVDAGHLLRNESGGHAAW